MRINGERLNNGDFSDFEEILRDIFNPGEFKTMLRKHMGWRILDTDADDKNIFTKMIDRAENDEETQELLEAALKEKTKSQKLKDFAQHVGISLPASSSINASMPLQTGPSNQAPRESPEYLERKVKALGSSLQPKQWRERMAQRERQICRIVIEGWEDNYGTGFLVNSDVVMTNYHVLQNVIDGEDRAIPSGRVSFYFDYALKEDRRTFEGASEHHLIDGKWHLDHSEHSDFDRQHSEHCLDIDDRRLDFVLLRLAKKAGEEEIDGVKRGWIEMPEMEYPFQSETPIFILHHPNGNPLTFDLDTRAVLEVNARKTRVRYTTTTESGSSGAPCFTVNWELIAIHQSGDPDYARSAEYNQGIPIFTILQRLKRYRTDKYLGSKINEKMVVSTDTSLDKETGTATNTSLIKVGEPEDMFSVEEQYLLVSLLDKEDLATCFSSNTKVFSITREMIEHIDEKTISTHLHSLVKGYAQVIVSLVEKAKEPFFAPEDLRPIHFRQASERLDLVEDCLRKICLLVKRAIPFLEPEKVNHITQEADNLIFDKENMSGSLVIEKEQYETKNSNRIKIRFKSIFMRFEKNIKEFLKFLAER